MAVVPFDAVYGYIRLKSQFYLILVTKSTKVAEIAGCVIMQANKFEFVGMDYYRSFKDDDAVHYNYEAEVDQNLSGLFPSANTVLLRAVRPNTIIGRPNLLSFAIRHHRR